MGLVAIVNFLQDMEAKHVFDDGNLRTFGMLMLNWFLTKWLDESPTILYDPNQLECLSISEYVDEVKKGQKCWQKVQSQYQSDYKPRNIKELCTEIWGRE